MLAFLCSSQFWGELLKMVAQFAGAALIAWLTVRWALGRYKTEKMWEREASAMFDVLDAIAAMKDVNSEWLSQIMQEQHDAQLDEPPPKLDPKVAAERDAALLAKWRDAKRRLDAVSAVASIVLSEHAEAALSSLNNDLTKPFDDYLDDLTATDVALRKAREALIAIGRKRFGVNNVSP